MSNLRGSSGSQKRVDLFEFDTADFIDGIELGGAAAFFEFAGEADITLFI